MTLQSMGPRAPADAVDEQIARLAPWFHNLHLPDGRETAPDHPLGDFPRFKWEQLAPALPADLTGWTALDVGCNAGYYSIELARRGADVLAIDHDEHYLRQARWATERFGLGDRIRFENVGVYDLARLDRRFDLVLFMGVMYHLRYPLLALDIVADKAERLLVLQTLTMPGDDSGASPPDIGMDERDRMLEPGWPKMAFIENRLEDDDTNWWAPSPGCIQAMLRSTGLRVVARPGHEMYVCEAAPGRPPHVVRELHAATGRTRDIKRSEVR